MSTVPMRSWWDIDHDKGLGHDLDPIDEFIHYNEPAGEDQETHFREQLQQMLDHVYELGIGDICADYDNDSL